MRPRLLLTLLLTTGLAAIATTTLRSKQDDTKPVLRALILDGQNNHAVWPKATVMLRSYLLSLIHI